MTTSVAQATLGGGCFWCIESAFNHVNGILNVESGYAGGDIVNPTYEQVCSGRTGHAEVVQLSFDPAQISYREILEIFFALHDPTQLNRQGNDVGTQYRSCIFSHNSEQTDIANDIIAEIQTQQIFTDPVVTTVEPLTVFYPAEDYHRDYYNRNPENAYCQAVVSPKLAKFRKTFADKLKS
ncbi:peptide-methionine (S)-S-oxide reductase MsrA [Idiomarina xiamenensis]|uniref:Peptide methionine sulfoxide reductase MsrA n=1 Tax=Idiomarina xiamenensis 10-D-4 TaxID=740709 RepID=K2KBR1_9GAMM|nr:peptide-methionine (S)-S-oxide reductase MsrA [Idiomarina xiamenensis]EKE85233.1 peptide methionine sulfoxide reductase [Idiomarina xiamenensis 10-D-4]